MSRTTGIETRHSRGCAAGNDPRATCRCQPTFRAWVYDSRSGKKLRESFSDASAARLWRADAVGDVKRGKRRASTSVTLRGAWEVWKDGAETGAVRTRSGRRYKPSALRGYEQAMRLRVLPDWGSRKLSDVRLTDLQELADRWLAEGLDASTIRNTLMPLRAVYRRALSRGDVGVNPTAGLELPAVDGRRERIAEPGEAAKLIAALPEGDRALWATAFYGGLRLGEMRALEFGSEGLDLGAGVIRVTRSWDPKAGVVEPKSRAGIRAVPIAGVLRDYLDQHRVRIGRSEGLVFGRSATRPFNPSTIAGRAKDVWAKADPPLKEIGLHEARHTFASLLIEAGVSPKKVSTYMGHSSVAFTLDRYAKLFEAHEKDTLEKLDEFLERADTAARLAQVNRGPVVGQ